MKLFRILILIILFILNLASITYAQKKNAQGHTGDDFLRKYEITPEFAKKIIDNSRNDSNMVLVDVRSPEEYQDGHIEGARNINFLSPDFKEKISLLDKNKTYVLYCRSGHRSGLALKIFMDNGFKNVYHIKGGIINWKNKKLPVFSDSKVKQ